MSSMRESEGERGRGREREREREREEREREREVCLPSGSVSKSMLTVPAMAYAMQRRGDAR